MDLGMGSDAEFNTTAHALHHLDAQKVIGKADGCPEHYEDVNASIPNMDSSSTQNEDTYNSIREAMNTNDKESNPSLVDDEARDDVSTRGQTDPEQQELHAAKQHRAKRVAGEKRTRAASTRRQADPEQQERLAHHLKLE